MKSSLPISTSPFGRDHNGDNAGLRKLPKGFGKKPSEVNLLKQPSWSAYHRPFAITPLPTKRELKTGTYQPELAG